MLLTDAPYYKAEKIGKTDEEEVEAWRVDANDAHSIYITEQYFTCCGKGICGGCAQTFKDWEC